MSGIPNFPSYVYANEAAAARARGDYASAARILNRGGQRAGANEALGEATRKYATNQALNALGEKSGHTAVDMMSPQEIMRRMAAESPYDPQQQTHRHPGMIYTKGKGVDAPPPPAMQQQPQQQQQAPDTSGMVNAGLNAGMAAAGAMGGPAAMMANYVAGAPLRAANQPRNNPGTYDGPTSDGETETQPASQYGGNSWNDETNAMLGRAAYRSGAQAVQRLKDEDAVAHAPVPSDVVWNKDGTARKTLRLPNGQTAYADFGDDQPPNRAGATIEGLPADEWFQRKANAFGREGGDNGFANTEPGYRGIRYDARRSTRVPTYMDRSFQVQTGNGDDE